MHDGGTLKMYTICRHICLHKVVFYRVVRRMIDSTRMVTVLVGTMKARGVSSALTASREDTQGGVAHGPR